MSPRLMADTAPEAGRFGARPRIAPSFANTSARLAPRHPPSGAKREAGGGRFARGGL
jgi:hypothetical protein